MDLSLILKEVEDNQEKLINSENKMAHYFLGLSKAEIYNIDLKLFEKCLPILKNSLINSDYIKVYDIFVERSLSKVVENKSSNLHFPILKDMKTVSDTERLVIDEILSHYKKNQLIYPQSNICKPLRLFINEDIWSELYDLGILDITYRYITECACPLFCKSDIRLSKRDYEDLKLYFAKFYEKFDDKRMNELSDIIENSVSYCDSCDLEFIIEDLDDMDKYIEMEYRLLIDKIK